jgi:hypothetical protein
LTGLAIILILVIGYLWLQIRNARQKVFAPVFSKQYSIVAGEIHWQLKNFQPIIKGFATENEQNLVLVRFTGQNGQEKEAKLFMSGKTPGGYRIEEIVLQAANGENEKLTFDQLKKRLKKGMQIRAQYINALPEFLDVRDCQVVTENFRKLCFLTDVLVSQKFKGTVEEKLKSGGNSVPTVPITHFRLPSTPNPASKTTKLKIKIMSTVPFCLTKSPDEVVCVTTVADGETLATGVTMNS